MPESIEADKRKLPALQSEREVTDWSRESDVVFNVDLHSTTLSIVDVDAISLINTGPLLILDSLYTRTISEQQADS